MIRVRCPQCGQESAAPSTEYLIYRCTNRVGLNYYTYRCQHCGETASPRCDPMTQGLLTRHGVCTTSYELPDEMDDPQRSAREPLSVDDLLDLMNDMEGAA